MHTIQIGEEKYTCRPDETVLEALLRQGVEVKSSCKKATCGTCKTRLQEGVVPAGSQEALTDEWIDQNYILLCVSKLSSDIQLDQSTVRYKKNASKPSNQSFEFREEHKSEIPTPDPELWDALGKGELLLEILTDFYNKVYKDPKLAPFFENTTIDRAIGKQYNFLQELMTGEQVYFGAMPRSAHHWMVIDEALFDYRENLIAESMRAFDLSEKMIKRWLDMDYAFKDMLIKDHPWPNIIGGVTVPITGFDTMVADFDMICDSCQREISMGETVGYHQEDAKIFCKECSRIEK
jgi:ferredoxin/truncated hemoglobin YjbI